MNKSAVVMIDMQDFFLENLADESRRKLIENQSWVLDLCAKREIPLFVFEYNAGGVLRGPTTKLLQDKARGVSGVTIVKDNNSAFVGTNLHERLKEKKIRTLFIIGINANGCVQDTAMGALRRGYKVFTSTDLIASTSRGTLGLSKRNEHWYRSNNLLLKNVQEVVDLISRANY